MKVSSLPESVGRLILSEERMGAFTSVLRLSSRNFASAKYPGPRVQVEFVVLGPGLSADALSRDDQSGLQFRYVDPAAFFPTAHGAFDQLHALGAFEQVPFVGRALRDVADEGFPLQL